MYVCMYVYVYVCMYVCILLISILYKYTWHLKAYFGWILYYPKYACIDIVNYIILGTMYDKLFSTTTIRVILLGEGLHARGRWGKGGGQDIKDGHWSFSQFAPLQLRPPEVTLLLITTSSNRALSNLLIVKILDSSLDALLFLLEYWNLSFVQRKKPFFKKKSLKKLFILS